MSTVASIGGDALASMLALLSTEGGLTPLARPSFLTSAGIGESTVAVIQARPVAFRLQAVRPRPSGSTETSIGSNARQTPLIRSAP